MKLTPEQGRKFVSHVQKFNPKCPICHSNNFNFNDTLSHLVSYNETAPGSLLSDNVDYAPLATMTCLECGYNMCFHAMVLGIYSK